MMLEIDQMCERAEEEDDDEDAHNDELDSKPWWPTVRILLCITVF
jgi:hypothetical protein